MYEEKNLEEQLTRSLTEGEMQQDEPKEEARELLIPRYEVRIKTQMDPIVEETNLFRKMSKEVDSRYDKYVVQNPKEEK